MADLIHRVKEGPDVFSFEEIRSGLHHVRCMAGEKFFMCVSNWLPGVVVGVATAVVCLNESQPILYHGLFDAKCSGHLKPGA